MVSRASFFAMDMEFEQPNMEILSVGLAYEGVDEAGIPMTRQNFLITPSAPVSEFIQTLTGLTNDRFDFNRSRQNCYDQLIEFHLNKKAELEAAGKPLFKEAITWGQGESKLLKTELKHYDLDAGISDRVIDLKTLLMIERLTRGRTISAKMSLRTGLKENKVIAQGDAHDSGWDAWNTLRLFQVYRERNQVS